MVDSIRSRAVTRPPQATAANRTDATPGAASFDTALGQAMAATSAPSSPWSALQASPLPPRLNPQVALHCLAVGARPRPALRFAPVRLYHPAATPSMSGPSGIRTSRTIAASATAPGGPLALAGYPRPANDNGRGIHWIPTTHQSPEVVDRFVERVKSLDVRWVTFLNEPGDLKGNEYLVSRLKEAGAMPVMRIYSEGTQPMGDEVSALVRHYREQGVTYFQLYNEPNLKVETGGQAPDPQSYARAWIGAAKQVVAAGGLPGLAPMSPQGDADDLAFLRESLQAIKDQGGAELLNRAWASVHNYGRDYLRVRQYDQVIRDVVGHSMPQISTEAGIYPGSTLSEAEQVKIVTDAYNYLPQREPYYFAYSLWCLANRAGGGHDDAWEQQVLYREDGPTALARALENRS